MALSGQHLLPSIVGGLSGRGKLSMNNVVGRFFYGAGRGVGMPRRCSIPAGSRADDSPLALRVLTMTRHGFSHGAATLITSLAAGLILDQIRHDIPALSGLLLRTAYELSLLLPFYVEPQLLAVALAATVLAIGWGILFGIFHERRRPPPPPPPPYWRH